MHHFIAAGIEGEWAWLGPAESHHLHRVLRLQAPQEVSFTIGDGVVYRGRIGEAGGSQCTLKLLQKERVEERPRLHLAVGPPKTNERYRFLLEKCTELGVASITPLRCRYSERKKVRPEKDRSAIEAAVKQSHKGYIPALRPMVTLSAFLAQPPEGAVRYLSHLEAGPREALGALDWVQDTLVLIGPEGDFAPEEIAAAREAGFLGLDLGAEVLRTETAAMAVAAAHLIKRGLIG